MTMNCGVKIVKRKWKKENIITYATWNVGGGDSPQRRGTGQYVKWGKITIAVITESKKMKDTMETNNYIVIYVQWCKQKYTSTSRCNWFGFTNQSTQLLISHNGVIELMRMKSLWSLDRSVSTST